MQTGANITQFLYDGVQVIAEYDYEDDLLRRYVFGPGINEPLVQYEGDDLSDPRWLLGDERGSIIAITDDGGDALNINAYDEYGVPASSNVGTFQYTGQMWLAGAQLYHYRARVYSADLGRFMQTDPIGFGGGVNLYAYVGNDPTTYIDVYGFQETPTAPITYPDDGLPIIVHGITVAPPNSFTYEQWLRLPFHFLADGGGSGASGGGASVLSRVADVPPDEEVVTVTPERRPQTWIIPPWLFRGTPTGIFIWVFTPTNAANATCRSASNSGGYDCSAPEPGVGPGDPDWDAAREECVQEFSRLYDIGRLPGPDGRSTSDQPGAFRFFMRQCMADRGFDF